MAADELYTENSPLGGIAKSLKTPQLGPAWDLIEKMAGKYKAEY